MEHAEGWTIGTVLDGLHLRKISQTIPGHGRPGTATPLGPLHGPGLSEGGTFKGAYELPT